MARLRIKQDGGEKVHELVDQITSIGRASVNIVKIIDESLSRKHCRIEREGDTWRLVDLESQNNTRVNNVKVDRQTLKSGDIIKAGNVEIIFEEDIQVSPEEFDRTVPIPVTADPASMEDRSAVAVPEEKERFILVRFDENGKEEETFELGEERFTMGRHASNTLVIVSENVSNYHMEIAKEESGYVLADLGSTNGTRVNDEKVIKVPLAHGARIEVGQITLVFRNTALPEKTEGQPMFGTVALTDEEFFKSLEKEVQGSKGAKYMGLVTGIVAIGVIAFLVLKVDIKSLFSSLPEVTPIENNLIDNFSFEQGLTMEGYPTHWRLRRSRAVSIEVDTENAKIGAASLRMRLMANTPAPETARSEYDQSISIKDSAVWQVDGWVKTSQLQGVAALALTWEGRSAPGLSAMAVSVTISGTQDWRRIHGVLIAPSWATNARFSCIASGTSGTVWFDQLSLTPADETALSLHKVVYKDLTFEILPNGCFSVFRNNQPILWNGRIILDGGSGTLVDQAFAEIESDSLEMGADIFQCDGRMMDWGSMEWIRYHQEIREGPDGVKMTCRFALPQGRSPKSVGLAVSSGPEVLAGGVEVDDGLELLKVSGESFAYPETAELIWHFSDGDLAWQMAEGSILKGAKQFAGHVAYQQILAATASSGAGFSVSAVFKTVGSRAGKQIDLIFEKALALEANGQVGAALAAFEAMVKQYSSRPEADEAAVQIKRLSKEAKTSLNRLENALKQAAALPLDVQLKDPSESEKTWQRLKRQASEMATQYAGCGFGDRAAAVSRQVDEELAKLQTASQDVLADALFAKGESAYKQEKWTRAKTYFDQVTSRYPNTEWAKKAAGRLRSIESLKQQAVERDTWVNKEMQKARNYLLNPSGKGTARSILLNILRRYPETPRKSEIEQMLQSAG